MCYLPIPTRKLFVNAYILPHIDYCCTVWGNINSTLTDSMIKLQKGAARIILDNGIDTPSVEMFNQLSWMTFPERVTFQKAVMMYKFFNNPTPSYLPAYFRMTSDIHQRSCFISHYHILDPKYGMPSQTISSKVPLLLISREIQNILCMFIAFCIKLYL